MTSPTQSASTPATFDSLHLSQKILDSLARNKFESATPIQAEVIPFAVAGQDIMGLAKTGTGKTAAFVLPILERLAANPGKGVKALIIAPTRELVNQIEQAIRDLRPVESIRSVSIVGGMNMFRQIQAIKRGAQIIVACPGRLLDHIRRKTLRLNDLEVLVLDEADRMMDMGFQEDLKELLRHIPEERQTMLFSATMPNELRSLAESFLTDPKTVKLTTTEAAPSVDHRAYFVPHAKKTALAVHVLLQAQESSSLVFTRTKRGADRLADSLENSGIQVTALHGDLSQRQRDRAMTGFRNGQFRVLVATDIAARGIDVSSIGHVVNYDMPDTFETFVHRIGRTGRANRRGEAHTFVTSEDAKFLYSIERNLKTEMQKLEVDGITEAPRRGERGEREDSSRNRRGGSRNAGRSRNQRRDKSFGDRAGERTPRAEQREGRKSFGGDSGGSRKKKFGNNRPHKNANRSKRSGAERRAAY